MTLSLWIGGIENRPRFQGKTLIERGYEIDTKLKLAKREFRDGLYIEELLR